MRAILDTNVWLDWLVFADPRVAPLAAAIESGRLAMLATEPMLAEFAVVVARPQFALDEGARTLACTRQRAAVAIVAPAPDCRLPCTDPVDRRDDALLDLVPDSPRRAYDMYKVIRSLVDHGVIFDLKPRCWM